MSGESFIEWAQTSPNARRKFVCYFYFVGWDLISLGASLCWSLPNLEIHLPFGFIRIGMSKVFNDTNTGFVCSERTLGWAERSAFGDY